MLRKLAGFVAAAGMVATVACGQTDAGITTNVKTKFAADDMVKAYQVDVDTQNRVVTLTGSVEDTLAKERALMIARDTDGVRDVIDQIRVSEAAATSGIDIDVDNDVEASARRAGESTKNTAEKVGDSTADAAKKAGQATVDGAKKVGGAVRDAVTDDDPDSDNDGH